MSSYKCVSNELLTMFYPESLKVKFLLKSNERDIFWNSKNKLMIYFK
jgi:hypothetical protein